MPQSESRQTIHAVASAAGVSAATVSRVINGYPGVRERTRETVLAAIERLNYTPNLSARELSSRQTSLVGLNSVHKGRRFTPFDTLFREQLFAQLYQQGFRHEDVPASATSLPEWTTDVMLLGHVLDDDPRVPYLNEKGVPFVVLGEAKNAFSVAPDDYGGGRQAAEHLLRLGHEDILLVTGGSARPRTAHLTTMGQAAFGRQRGFEDTLEAANLSLPRERVVRGDFSTLGAFLATSRALRAGLSFSAIFALSDEMAEGAIAAVEEAGLRVPDDISVVGYDDLPEIGESFTTIHQDIPEFVRVALELIQEALASKPLRQVVIPVQLVVRGTTTKQR